MSWIRAVGTSVLVLAAAASVTAQTQTNSELNPVILKVNGEPVRAADVSLVMQRIAPKSGATGTQPSAEQLAELATQRVIERKLLAQEARRLGLQPDMARVEQSFQKMVEQAGGEEALKAALAKGGTNIEQVRAILLDEELVRMYVETQVKPGLTVSDEEVDAFYAANPQQLASPEKVRARHVLVEVPVGAAPADEAAALSKAQAARARILAGEDFAKVAREMSDCPSAEKGGELGTFALKTMLPPFAEACRKLAVGQTSEPVRTDFGYHVIQVEERFNSNPEPLDKIREPLRNSLRLQKGNALVQKALAELKAKANIETMTPEAKPAAPAVPPSAPAPAPAQQ